MRRAFRKNLRQGFAVFLASGLVFGGMIPAQADLFMRPDPLALELVQDHILISTGFTGAVLTVFGNKRGDGEIVILLEGPEKNNMVRKKERVLGAWMNRSWLQFNHVPAYYDYADNVFKDADLMSEDRLRQEKIGVQALSPEPVFDIYETPLTRAFQEALIRNKQKQNLFPVASRNIVFLDNDLFRVDFPLPSNVPRGEYTVRGVLVRDGQVVFEATRKMSVGQAGLSAKIYKMAHQQSALYGVLCVLIACVAGWVSNLLVRK